MGSIDLTKIQLGAESPAGTKAAATIVLRGTGALKDTSKIEFPDDPVGIMGGTDNSINPEIGSSLAFSSVASYERLPYLLEASIKAVGTAAADGTGTGKIYTYPFHGTTKNTIRSYTIEYGDDSGAEVATYGIVNSFTLSGQYGGPLMMTANWLARGTAPQAFTSLAPVVVNPIMFGTGRLAIDAIGGTIGATPVTATLKALTINFSGAEPIGSIENLYFTTHDIVTERITGTMSLYWNASSIAEKAKWKAQTSSLVQLKWTGPAVTQGNGIYATMAAIINLYGCKWTDFSEIKGENGKSVVTASFDARYNIAGTNNGNIIVVNTLATLP